MTDEKLTDRLHVILSAMSGRQIAIGFTLETLIAHIVEAGAINGEAFAAEIEQIAASITKGDDSEKTLNEAIKKDANRFALTARAASEHKPDE